MAGQTPLFNIRVPRKMWTAYGRVCARLGRERTEDLLEHMRRQIRRHGDEADRADLTAAEDELRERRARKGGRPRNQPAQSASDGAPAITERD